MTIGRLGLAAGVAVCAGFMATQVAQGQFGDVLNKAKSKAGINNGTGAPAVTGTTPSAGKPSVPGTRGGGLEGYKSAPPDFLSTAEHTGAPMPGLEDKIVPGEAQAQIDAVDLDRMKTGGSNASADWTRVPYAPASEMLVSADGYQHRETEGQREAGHLFSIREQRTFVTNCLADEKACGTNYGKEEKLLAQFCGKKFTVTLSDSVIIKNIHYGRNVMGDVESMNGVLWGLCQTNKDQVLANVTGFKLGTIPARANHDSASVGQEWLYDKATKTVTVNYPPGPAYNDDRTLHMWILRNAK